VKIAFNVIVERDEEGLYTATVPELRGCYTQARSLDNTHGAIQGSNRLQAFTERLMTGLWRRLSSLRVGGRHVGQPDMSRAGLGTPCSGISLNCRGGDTFLSKILARAGGLT